MSKNVEVLLVEDNPHDVEMTMRALEKHKLGNNSFVVKPIVFEAFARTIADVGFYWLAVNQQ